MMQRELDPMGEAHSVPATVATVQDLKVHFQSKRGIVHSVDGVSFEIRDGETLGIVGETGCGKSVTGRSFLRLLPVPPGIIAGGSVTFRPHAVCAEPWSARNARARAARPATARGPRRSTSWASRTRRCGRSAATASQ